MFKHAVTTLLAVTAVTAHALPAHAPHKFDYGLRCIGQEAPELGGEIWHVRLNINTNTLYAQNDSFTVTSYKQLDDQTMVAVTAPFKSDDGKQLINVLGIYLGEYYFVQYELQPKATHPRYITDIKLACDTVSTKEV